MIERSMVLKTLTISKISQIKMSWKLKLCIISRDENVHVLQTEIISPETKISDTRDNREDGVSQ